MLSLLRNADSTNTPYFFSRPYRLLLLKGFPIAYSVFTFSAHY